MFIIMISVDSLLKQWTMFLSLPLCKCFNYLTEAGEDKHSFLFQFSIFLLLLPTGK